MKLIGSLLVISSLALASCGGPSGPKEPMTEAQFEEVKANCDLGDGRLGSTNYTQETTTADGVSMTITREDAEPDAVTIFLSKKREEGAMAEMILCLNKEFDRLGAEAGISLPEDQF